MRDGFTRKKVQKVVSKTGAQITIARLRGPLESLSPSAPGCAFPTFANNKSNSWRDMPMGVLKRLAFSDSLVHDSM